MDLNVKEENVSEKEHTDKQDNVKIENLEYPHENLDNQQDNPISDQDSFPSKKPKQQVSQKKPPKERKPLQRLNQLVVRDLIRLFNLERKLSNSEIAICTNLSNRAVYRARNQYYETGNIQSTGKKRASEKVIAKHSKIIELAKERLFNNPYQTMSDLCRELEMDGVCVSRTTVSRILKKQRFTYKKLTYIPFSRNTDAVMRKRLQYCKQLKQMKDEDLYFTDETAFNLKTAPNYGWALKGREVSMRISDKPGETVSVLAIISMKGLQSFRIIKGTAKAENIEGNFRDNALPNIPEGAFLVMDNVRSHRSQEIMRFIQETKLKVKYLPPYSPQLNPIQNFFGTIKGKFRRLRVSREIKTTKQLVTAVSDVFTQQYQQGLENYYRKMREYVDLGAQNLPFERNL